PPQLYTLSLHDALPISSPLYRLNAVVALARPVSRRTGSKPVRFAKTTCRICKSKKSKGEDAMARQALGYLPQQNPCAQCGEPIRSEEHTSELQSPCNLV